MNKVHAQKVQCAHDKVVPLVELQPNPRNANQHPQSQIELLAKVMKWQGVRHPIVVSKRSGFIVKGHGRLEAAKLNSWDKFPIDLQDYESEAQEYADMVADNKIQELAASNMEMIIEDARKFKDELPDFDMLGIPDFQLPEDEQAENERADEVPEVTESTTKLGDLWLLGEHRVLCGDCTDEKNIETLMQGEKADMVFTDPPYNLASDSKNFAAGTLRKGSYGKLRDSDWDKGFVVDGLKVIEGLISEKASVYVCTSHFLAGEIWKWMVGWAHTTNYCVWAKPNPMPSLTKKHWTWSSELICYAAQKNHIFNFPTDGHALNVWGMLKSPKNDLHPTMKPVSVPGHAISHSSAPNTVIWDGFLGSGSTLIACEKTNRKCYGMEIDPHYVDVIVARWEKFTGKKAKRGTPD